MPVKYIRRNKKNQTGNQTDRSNETKLDISLEQNIAVYKNIFSNDDTLVYRRIENQQNTRIKCCAIFIDGMANSETIYESIIKPIVQNELLNDEKSILDELNYKVIVSNDVERTADVNKIVESVIGGDTLLLIDGEPEALIINTKGWQFRAVEEPESEKATRAPREGFTESLMVNLSLLRRKLKIPDLKFNFRTLGVKSRTKACVCYIKGIANEKILQELERRLDSIDIDGILGTGYIQELISDSPFSPFNTMGFTERPDVIASKLLEGRIAIFVDNTPFVLTVPHLLIEDFQINEDYYEGYLGGSIARVLRIFSFTLTITVPALFIALTSFHQEMIPTPLLLSILAARKGIPFPLVFSALSMIIVFEILREVGARMPTYIGQALSIVGALVIGQAAVDARIVSAPMVIVIAFSSITSLMISSLRTAALILRIIFLLLASFFGVYGLVFGITGLLIHLFEMRSFGIPYMYNLDIMSFEFQDLKDVYIRAPWHYMKSRPKFIAVKNIIRKSSGGRRV